MNKGEGREEKGCWEVKEQRGPKGVEEKVAGDEGWIG